MGPAASARARLRRRIVAAGVVLVVAFVGSSGYDAWRSYCQLLDDTDRELSNLAQALADRGARSLQAVDVLLRDTAEMHVALGSQATPDRIHEMLANRAAGLPQVRTLNIVDARGILRHSSRPSPEPHALDVSDRPSFIAHRDHPATGLFVSGPDVIGDGERMKFVLSRRLDDASGQFAGIVNATLEHDDVEQFYRAIKLGAGSAISLLRDDGTLVVRHPPSPELIGRTFPDLVAVENAGPSRLKLATLIAGPIDGMQQFAGLARVRDLPFVMTVTRDAAVALRPWRGEMVNVVIRTLVLVLLGTLLIAALVRQLRRVEAAEAENAALEARLRQSQKMEAMGTLAGGIAHDFNNILGAILGYGELAQRAAGAAGPVRRYVDQMIHAGGRAKALVARILAFSRSGLGHRLPVHVESAVRETLDLLGASLPPGVRLERRLAAGDAAVIGDPTQLHQVVMNLCTNAVHAMARSGVLTVTLERVEVREARALTVGSLAAQNYVRLTVGDTGSGIAPAVLERMFDPFFTTKSVGEGTGLGLPLVHGIVADLGGAIDVATVVGQGTTFAVWLPVSGETAKPLAGAARERPRGNGEAVMIVDDEPALVALAEEMLADLGYEPAGFGSSVAALRAFAVEPQRFDAVLTDETMPELTGTDLAREIRQLRPGIPIVLMSGYSGPALAARAAGAGVSGVLRKPLESRDIAEALTRALGSAR